jgi:SOS response associated peptidase (SRAP)
VNLEVAKVQGPVGAIGQVGRGGGHLRGQSKTTNRLSTMDLQLLTAQFGEGRGDLVGLRQDAATEACGPRFGVDTASDSGDEPLAAQPREGLVNRGAGAETQCEQAGGGDEFTEWAVLEVGADCFADGHGRPCWNDCIMILKFLTKIQSNNIELCSARFGLVPNEFSSSRKSERYKLHAIHAERIEYQLAVSRVFAQTRCVIPVQSAMLESVNALEDRGEVIWLAGMWTQYEQPSARVESCAVITRLNRVDDSRGLIELKPEEFAEWLEPSTPLELV